MWNLPITYVVICFFINRKQRKKLHDRLRQSLRNKRNNNANTGPNTASSARGRQVSNMPLQDLQLINVCCYSLASKYVKSARSPQLLMHFLLLLFSNVMEQQNNKSLRRRKKLPFPQANIPYLSMNPPHSPASPAKGKKDI